MNTERVTRQPKVFTAHLSTDVANGDSFHSTINRKCVTNLIFNRVLEELITRFQKLPPVLKAFNVSQEALNTPKGSRRLVFSSPKHSDYESADSDDFDYVLRVLENGKLHLVNNPSASRTHRKEVISLARCLEDES